MLGVPGYLGVKGQSALPVALDISFSVDSSGSMGAVWSYVRDPETIRELDRFLVSKGVGSLSSQRNRYSLLLSSLGPGGGFSVPHYEQAINTTIAARWLMGGPTAPYAAWGASSNRPTAIPKTTEDISGQAWWMLANYTARAGDYDGSNARVNPAIEQIIILASDEQADTTLRPSEATTLLPVLNTNNPLKRIIGFNSYTITVNAAYSPGPTFVPFGVIFNDRANYFVTYINTALTVNPDAGASVSGTYRVVQSVPSTAVTFTTAGGIVHTTAMPVVPAGGTQQIVNTVALANATGSAYNNTGAVYDIQVVQQATSDAEARLLLNIFGASLGDALGGLIYGLINP